MNILLIQPTTIRRDGSPLKTPTRWIIGLPISYVAGLTPPEVKVELCDERVQEVNFDGKYDLVGITTTIGASYRGYQLAAEFRKRGVPVVMGGFHATLSTEETLQHCESVVVGEADQVWQQVLEDCQKGGLKRIYRAPLMEGLCGRPRPRHELLNLSLYRVKMLPIQATRGCPYKCSFCEVPVFYNRSYRCRPVGDVVKEVQELVHVTGIRNFQFVDDQLTGKHAYAKELFKALIPLRVKFSCLWSISAAHDPELLDLATKAGVYHVNIGVESINQDSLRSIEKVHNHIKEYKDLIARLKKRGIFYSLNFLFGMDGDRAGIFEATLKFLMEVKAPMAFFNTVTPRRGTPLRERLEKEGRILDPDAERFTNSFVCTFMPKHMRPEDVTRGVWWCTENFYSLSSIVRRLLLPPNAYTYQGILSNFFFWWGAKHRIDPVDYY